MPLAHAIYHSVIFNIHLHTRTKNLNLIRVHSGIGDQKLHILQTLGLVDTKFLVKNKTFIQIRLRELSTGFLDDLDMTQVGRSLQSKHGVTSEGSKVLAVLSENLRTQCRAGDGMQILAESNRIVTAVNGGFLESGKCGFAGYPVSVDDGLRVNLFVHEDLGLSEQLGCEDCDGGSSITDFVVLNLGNVDKDLSKTLLFMCLLICF